MESNYSKSNSAAMSDDIRLLAQGLLAAKKEFIATGFGGVNNHQKYKYAKIEDIYNAVEKGLASNNIIICHFARPVDGVEILYTRLIHTLSGQFIEDARILESEKPGNQGKGAANTYMKKYAVLSLCAIATEDDDGEEEQRHIEKRAKEPDIDEQQLLSLQAEIKSAANNMELYTSILKAFKIDNLKQLKASSFESVKAYIANKRA